MGLTMKTLLLLFALLPNFGLAADNGRLACDFSNGYFRVFDGQTKFEKYVTSANSEDVLLECGNKAAAAISVHISCFSKTVDFTRNTSPPPPFRNDRLPYEAKWPSL